ncbi:MAG: FHA domain-containing protein [Anaerolineae bacterium]
MSGPGEKRTTTLDSRITCPYCGYENPVISLICKRCGRLLDRDAAAQAAQAATPARGVSAPGPTPQSARSRFGPDDTLVIHVQGSRTPLKVRLEEELVIGRSDPSNNAFPGLDLSLYDALEKGVSRRHAAIRREGETLQLIDLSSPNGTFLNETRLTPRQPYPLRDGDELRFGHLVLRLYFRPRDADDAPA